MNEGPFDAADGGHRPDHGLGDVLRLWAGLSEYEHCLVELALADLGNGVFASMATWDRFVAAVVELRAAEAKGLSPAELHVMARDRALTD